ncbi:MAG: 3-hydroxyacyl-CoA dehydrogenase NAD-binding domain-containing protein [Alphaproteobacteria bacterium]|jgi:3-hydroxyacyl-CoA dehydrogenase
MTEQNLVYFERHGDIGVVIVDNPPVNALSPGVPEGIVKHIDAGAADPAIKAMVVIGAGRSFIAGADIRQFGKGRPPLTRKPYDAYEQSSKPIVAAIHGYALGGGLENALACHYRIAVASAKVGLPEVLIGLLPGGGGTQRLPRLIGPKAALDLIVSGRHVPAPEAAELGILDRVVPSDADLKLEAIKFANEISDKRPLRLIRDLVAKLPEGEDIFEAKKKEISRRARNQIAPYNNIKAVQAAVEMQFEDGLKRERELFEELVNSNESKALRYAFFAEREAQKLPDVPKGTPVKTIKTAAVVGAGTMGGGIAMCFADAGIPVQVLEISEEALEKGFERIRNNYEVSVKRGSLEAAEMVKRVALISKATAYEQIAEADVVIEAVFEEMGVKQQVFKEIDRVMKPDALLLTNTSALDIDQIAEVTSRPEKIGGAHFFSPANVMKLLEVVKGAKTTPEVTASTMALGKLISKAPAACGNCDGFLANRSRTPFNSEMVIMLEEGCLPEQVDKVMVEFGYPMGPFAVGDLAGLDIGYAGRKRRAEADPNYRTLPIADKLVEMGRLGQKTGAGWFKYEKGDRTPHPDPIVTDLINLMSKDMGNTPRSFTDEEILKRLLFSSVNEACKILEEKISYRASDVDIMWLYGFGFPRYRGGLMYWADGIGVQQVYNQIAAWHQAYGDRWAPSDLLRRLADKKVSFREAHTLVG